MKTTVSQWLSTFRCKQIFHAEITDIFKIIRHMWK